MVYSMSTHLYSATSSQSFDVPRSYYCFRIHCIAAVVDASRRFPSDAVWFNAKCILADRIYYDVSIECGASS